MTQRLFLDVDGRLVHYRRLGSGPPLVMLHPSPLSSAVVMPVAQALAAGFTVYALDTPGYGLSDRLPHEPRTLADYLDPLAATLDALGLGRVTLYGAATGAQIAVEFAHRYPARVDLLVMDTAGHIGEAQCAAILERYFPDVTPRADGAHLATWWHMVRELGHFFPWPDTRLAARIDRDLPPPAVLQALLLDYLRAGTGYALAYRPAFLNERAERVQRVPVPTVLTRWEGSIALSITDALIDLDLPPQVEVLPLGPSLAERGHGLLAALRRRRAATGSDASPVAAPAAAGRRYCDVGDGTAGLHARVWRSGAGRPLVVLHELGGSSALHHEFLAAAAASGRPVLALDLPGHGESACVPAARDSLAAHAALLLQAIQACGLEDFDVLGCGSGSVLAAELTVAADTLVGRQVLVGPWLLDEAERREFATDLVPELAPRSDGAHLLAAWTATRDAELYWPWFRRSRATIRWCEPQLAAQRLHPRCVELLKSAPGYAPLLQATCATPLAERLAAFGGETVLAATLDDPLEPRCVPAAALAPRADVLTLPAGPRDWPDLLW
jgi:pimeloyl-ACP methyl ester carboxylesterase